MLYDLLQRNLQSGMNPGAALESALAERNRIDRGQPPEVAKGTRKERKERRHNGERSKNPQG